MCILTVYIYLLFHLVIAQDSDNMPDIKTVFRLVVKNMFSSFINFSNNIRSYFTLPINKLEERKTIIESEFLNTITERIVTSTRALLNKTKKIRSTTKTTVANVTIITTATSKATTTTTEKTTTATARTTTAAITLKVTTTKATTTTITTMKDKRQSLNFVAEPITLTTDMIKENGYRAEAHSIQTKDGYNLILHRIPPQSKYNSKVVLLHHGLLGSSEDWLLLGSKSLPYLMADNGYDVWLANARGNRYSRSHLRMPVESSSHEYWNFSWHEIGYYDLSCTVDYILDVTGSKIDFVGYSMGATALLVLLSTKPQYNLKFRSAVLLAPLTYMYTATGPISYLAEIIDEHGLNALNFLGKNEYMKTENYPETIVKKFCSGPDILCSNPLLFLANGGKVISDERLMRNILSHVPGGGSTKTIIHYCQLVRNGGFQMFDYGVNENVKRYGMRLPPMYRLMDVTIPLAVISSSGDWLSTTSDVHNLIPRLPFALFHHIVKRKDFTHTDFVFSYNATKLVYCHVLQLLDTIVLDRPSTKKSLRAYSDVC